MGRMILVCGILKCVLCQCNKDCESIKGQGCFANNGIRGGSKRGCRGKDCCKIVALQLGSQYMTKSLTNSMYMYTPIQMEEGAPVSNHLGEFNKIILDLKNINCNLQSRG